MPQAPRERERERKRERERERERERDWRGGERRCRRLQARLTTPSKAASGGLRMREEENESEEGVVEDDYGSRRIWQ